MPIETNWKIEKAHEKYHGREEKEALEPAGFRRAFGKIAEAGGDAKAQNQQQARGDTKVVDEIESVAGAGIGDGLFPALVAEGILLGFGWSGRGWGGRLASRAGSHGRKLGRRRTVGGANRRGEE